ncbi:unnamed protein product [Thelazia callipaeda]|uniref:Transposase n=1 Tax=Thelazia callipaeda TaxID=103827 RepID=A0A0N5CQZ1_THECL|nr:unnamed protein product [Thelazia callipaeda]
MLTFYEMNVRQSIHYLLTYFPRRLRIFRVVQQCCQVSVNRVQRKLRENSKSINKISTRDNANSTWFVDFRKI